MKSIHSLFCKSKFFFSRGACNLALLLVVTSPSVSAQTDSTKIAGQLRQAQQKIEGGDKQAAKKLFEIVLDFDKNNVAAHLALGKLAIDAYDWRGANDHFEKLLESDPDHFDGHYFRAICYREIGKFRPEFLRKMPIIGGLLEFRKAQEHFEWVAQRDSLFHDVLFQLAKLKQYQEDFDAALQLAHRQVALKPQETAGQVGLFKLYRQFLLRNSEKKAIAYLDTLPWPHARFFIGEKLRREEKYAQADSIFQALLADNADMSLQPVYLALAKSKSSQGKDGAAEQFFWAAADNIRTDADAELIFEELKYIVDARELGHYRALQSPAEKAEFFRAFWARRNPMPAAEQNVRLTEHFRRLTFCEENYEFIGFRSWANSPDKLNYLQFPPAYHLNDVFNDKGLVYLRHGPPHDRIVTVGSGGSAQASLPPSNESWKYWSTEQMPEMTFHFIYDQFAAGNLWRLTPILSHPALLADRFQWNPRYYRMQNAFSAGERFALEQEMAQQSIASVDTGFVTDRHTWDEKVEALQLPFSTATFRGDDGETVLEVYWGVPLKPIVEALPEGESLAAVEHGVAIHHSNWQMVDKDSRTTRIPIQRENLSEDQIFTDLYKIELSPDDYFLALHARPQQTELIGGHAQIEVAVPDYSGEAFMLSDIEFASQIEPATAQTPHKLAKHGLAVLPNPTRQYARKRPVHIYFEIYNLQRDAAGETRFSIEYIVEKEGGKKFLGLFGGGKSSISVKSDRQGNSRFSAEFLAIDVQKIDKGEAMLTIRVTDKIADAVAEKSRQFQIY